MSHTYYLHECTRNQLFGLNRIVEHKFLSLTAKAFSSCSSSLGVKLDL